MLGCRGPPQRCKGQNRINTRAVPTVAQWVKNPAAVTAWCSGLKDPVLPQRQLGSQRSSDSVPGLGISYASGVAIKQTTMNGHTCPGSVRTPQLHEEAPWVWWCRCDALLTRNALSSQIQEMVHSEVAAYDSGRPGPLLGRPAMLASHMSALSQSQLISQMGIRSGITHSSPSPPGSKSATPSPSSSTQEEESEAHFKVGRGGDAKA